MMSATYSSCAASSSGRGLERLLRRVASRRHRSLRRCLLRRRGNLSRRGVGPLLGRLAGDDQQYGYSERAHAQVVSGMPRAEPRHVQLARIVRSRSGSQRRRAELRDAMVTKASAASPRQGVSRTRRASGRPVRDRATLARIRALAIPPAWTHVWISPDPDGHIQATGRDARGRKQYRYHAKLARGARRGEVPPARRVLPRAAARSARAVERDLACTCLCKRKVVATIVSLMERAQLRVGNEEYARAERLVRRDDAAQSPRRRFTGDDARARRIAARAASSAASASPIAGSRGSSASATTCRASGCSSTSTTTATCGRSRRRTSTTTCARSPAARSPRRTTARGPRRWRGAAAVRARASRAANARLQAVRQRGARAGRRASSATRRRCAAASYIHPRLLEDFTADRLATHARAPAAAPARAIHERDAIDVDALRAVEPAVARYLAAPAARAPDA